VKIGTVPLGVKLKAWFWTLERFFATPFFGAALFIGVALSGGSMTSLTTWLAFIAGISLMCAGHCHNSFLDYSWTGLDKGEVEDRSAEKSYCGGQNLIEAGVVSSRECAFVGLVWDAIGIGILVWMTIHFHLSVMMIYLAIMSAIIPIAYSAGKFTTWGHELSLGISCGPLPVLIGAFAVNPSPPVINLLLVSIIPAAILSFAGLAIDEFPDALANLKKGVKSLPYKVWQYSTIEIGIIPGGIEGSKSMETLRWYVTGWLLMVFIYHVFLINIGVLAPMTGIAFITLPMLLASQVFLKANFDKAAVWIVALGAAYLILLLAGQIIGG
jgi:hypothetical protein